MPTARPWDGYVRCYVSEAIVHHLRRAAAEPPLPGGEKKEGEAAGCSDKREAPTGKPWASRPCQCPRLARGIITLAATPAVARPAPECPRLARGMVAFAATSASQLYPISAGQRRSRRCPAERKRRGCRRV
jgi:hypothetical protein